MTKFLNQFPYSDFHEMNLDWVIKKVNNLSDKLDSFTESNSIKFADPINWNISESYIQNLIVFDDISQSFYISKTAVPSGIDISNEEYWLLITPFKTDVYFDENSINPIANKPVAIQFNELNSKVNNIDTQLTEEIATRTSQVTTESAERIAADNELSDRITLNTNNISAEVNTRVTSDNTINERIDNIISGASVDPDVELTDIRVGVNHSYSSAGNAVRGQISWLKQPIDDTTQALENNNILFGIPTSVGLVQNTGVINPNYSNFRTFNPVIIDDGTTYKVKDIGNVSTFSFYVCEFDNSDNVIYYSYVESPATGYDYNPHSGAVKLILSCGDSLVETYTLSIVKKTTKIDQIDINKNDINSLNNFLGIENYLSSSKIVVGRIQDDGTINSSVTNFRTIGPTNVSDSKYYKLSVPDVTPGIYSLYICELNASNTVNYYSYNEVSSLGFTYKPHANSTKVYFSASVNVTVTHKMYLTDQYDKFETLQNELDGIEVKNYTNDEIRYSYTGSELDLKINNSYLVNQFIESAYLIPPEGKTSQGFAIFGKYLFQFMNPDYCRVYNIITGETVSNISMTVGHGNTAQFSNTYYAVDDSFPLLYVSDTTGYVYVYRMTTTTATLVNTLYFDPAVFQYTAQLAVDNNIGYVVGNYRQDSLLYKARITKVDLTNLTDNNDNTFTPEIIEAFDVDITTENTFLQGVKYLNGCIYLPSGGYSTDVKSLINVINVNTKSISSILTNFPEPVYSHEIEDIDFIIDNFNVKYDIIVFCREYGYYKITF